MQVVGLMEDTEYVDEDYYNEGMAILDKLKPLKTVSCEEAVPFSKKLKTELSNPEEKRDSDANISFDFSGESKVMVSPAEPCMAEIPLAIPEFPANAKKHPTREEVEVDEYRWRKYGQCLVTASNITRVYYKCANSDCPVRVSTSLFSLLSQFTALPNRFSFCFKLLF